MTTIGVNRSRNPVDRLYGLFELVDVLPGADVSVLPSTIETQNLQQKKHFKAMKGSAIFVNIGRGDLVKEEVLIEVLQNREIAHAI